MLYSQAATADLRVLDDAAINRLTQNGANTGTLLDLRLIHDIPSVLDSRWMMSYFALLNNCEAPSAAIVKLQQKRLLNELDYADVADFYRNRANKIVSNLPTHVTFENDAVRLGQYDVAKGSFPVLSGPTPTSWEYRNVIPGRSSPGCPMPMGPLFPGKISRPPEYVLAFNPIAVREVKMDKEEARNYLDVFPGHYVIIHFEADILPDPPAENGGKFIYQAHLTKVTILSPDMTRQPQWVRVTGQGAADSRAVQQSRKTLSVVYP